MVYVETETQTQSQWPTRHLGTDLAERTQQTRECKRKKYKTSKHRPLKHKYQDNHLRISFFYVHIALLFRSLYVHQQVQNVELFSLFFGLDFNFRIAVVVFIPGFTFYFFYGFCSAGSDFVLCGSRSRKVCEPLRLTVVNFHRPPSVQHHSRWCLRLYSWLALAYTYHLLN